MCGGFLRGSVAVLHAVLAEAALAGCAEQEGRQHSQHVASSYLLRKRYSCQEGYQNGGKMPTCPCTPGEPRCGPRSQQRGSLVQGEQHGTVDRTEEAAPGAAAAAPAAIAVKNIAAVKKKAPETRAAKNKVATTNAAKKTATKTNAAPKKAAPKKAAKKAATLARDGGDASSLMLLALAACDLAPC